MPVTFVVFVVIGSPPHMRGTVRAVDTDTYEIRITPAHAGNSYLDENGEWVSWDHPRTCGEQCMVVT